eukprot:9682037-Alexandrium_andersonii.AAC.1
MAERKPDQLLPASMAGQRLSFSDRRETGAAKARSSLHRFAAVCCAASSGGLPPPGPPKWVSGAPEALLGRG